MAWICKSCAHVNLDASYKCMQCGLKRSENDAKDKKEDEEDKQQ